MPLIITHFRLLPPAQFYYMAKMCPKDEENMPLVSVRGLYSFNILVNLLNRSSTWTYHLNGERKELICLETRGGYKFRGILNMVALYQSVQRQSCENQLMNYWRES